MFRVPTATAVFACLIIAACSRVKGDTDTQGPGEGNLLQNSGFENGNGVPEGWSPEQRAQGKGEILVDSTRFHGGQHSVKLSPNQRNSPSDLAHGPLAVGQGFPADRFRGRRLYIAGWLGAEGGATAIAGLYAFRKNGHVDLVELRQDASKSGLSFKQDSLDIPNDKSIAFIIMNCHADGTSGAAYFDDMYLGASPPPTSSGVVTTSVDKPPSSGPFEVSIVVNASQEIRRIPRTIYGTNIEWIWDGGGLWDAKQGALNADILRLTQELQPSLIRFPGGVFADSYHWKDGVGPRNARATTLHMPGGPKSVHNFGTDEALDLSKRTQAPLLITANIVSGTPQEAAEWLRYIKGRTGPGKAPPVAYWELGNEQYDKSGSPQARASTMSPSEYVKRFREFAAALRAMDPSVKIGAVSDENYGHRIPHAYPDWTRTVLQQVGKDADFISVHNGYAPVLFDPKPGRVRDVYAAMLSAPQEIAQNLHELSDQIASLVPDPNRRVKIAITEWGPLFQFTPDHPYVDHPKTLGSALYVASLLKTFVETDRVEIANFFKLADPLFMGWIGTRDGHTIPKAPYYAFQMFTRHFGDVLVHSSVETPVYSSRSIGWVDASSHTPYVDVATSRSSDGKKLYVLAVNKSFDSEASVQLDLRGVSPAGTGTAWTLSGPSIDANTGTQLPRAPGVNWAKQASDDQNARFDRGEPGEVGITSRPLDRVQPRYRYSLPKHSVTSLEINLK